MFPSLSRHGAEVKQGLGIRLGGSDTGLTVRDGRVVYGEETEAAMGGVIRGLEPGDSKAQAAAEWSLGWRRRRWATW